MTTKNDDRKVREIHKDAEGQFAPTQAGGDNNGVASAKPRVITGSDDATAHHLPPGHHEKEDDRDRRTGYDR